MGQIWIVKEDQLAGHQKRKVELYYQITGAKTGQYLNPFPRTVTGYDATDFTQAKIDTLLGSSGEFDASTGFASVAMGTDAMGIVLDCAGQVDFDADNMIEVFAQLGSTFTGGSARGQTAVLPNTLAAPVRMQISSKGNVGIQIVLTGLDAATTGMIHVVMYLVLK
jgi:hypothetical protein